MNRPKPLKITPAIDRAIRTAIRTLSPVKWPLMSAKEWYAYCQHKDATRRLNIDWANDPRRTTPAFQMREPWRVHHLNKMLYLSRAYRVDRTLLQ